MSQSTQAVSDEIQHLKQTYPKYNGQLKHAVSIPAESANTIDATKILRERISSRLPHDGLFTHQADALNILKRVAGCSESH